MNTPSYLTVELLQRAKAEVLASPLYKRFISGTPLENDIAVWMADFAGQVLHEAEPSSPVADSPTWQPIETAPKDGSPVIVGAQGEKSVIAFWSQRESHFLKLGAQRPTILWPTHWMPLPSAPSPSAGAAQKNEIKKI